MAEFRDGLANLRTLKLAHNAAVSAYDVIVSGGHALVAVNDADADAENTYVYRGRVSFPKGSGAIAAGAVVYWDASPGVITTTSTDNTRAGICIEAALTADTEALVMLHEN